MKEHLNKRENSIIKIKNKKYKFQRENEDYISGQIYQYDKDNMKPSHPTSGYKSILKKGCKLQERSWSGSSSHVSFS